jgi:hypothetical protein
VKNEVRIKKQGSLAGYAVRLGIGERVKGERWLTMALTPSELEKCRRAISKKQTAIGAGKRLNDYRKANGLTHLVGHGGKTQLLQQYGNVSNIKLVTLKPEDITGFPTLSRAAKAQAAVTALDQLEKKAASLRAELKSVEKQVNEAVSEVRKAVA